MFGIKVIAYNPIVKSIITKKNEEFDDFDVSKMDIIKKLTEKYKKSDVQIISNWHLHRGVTLLRRSTNFDRQQENLNVYDFKLEDEEYRSISKLDANKRFYGLKSEAIFAGINPFA